MSGHSKWAQIKRSKGAKDVKRGVLFSQLAKKITLAAKAGGGADPKLNFQLAREVENAKKQGLPSDNIDRAIKNAFSADAVSLTEAVYEGYGPGGVAILVEVATDNTNRALLHVKTAFSKHGGALGAQGSVSWMFEPVGKVTITTPANRDELELCAIDAGADDVIDMDGTLDVLTSPAKLDVLKTSLEGFGSEVLSSQVIKSSSQHVNPDDTTLEKLADLMDALEDIEDVVSVHTNVA